MPAPTGNDLIDRVDVHDHVIGTVTRSDALKVNAGFRVVHVLVSNLQGEVLLQRIASGRARSPGRWGSSVAGYLHAGEAPRHGASRRMREEIGVVAPLHFSGRVRMDDEGSSKFIYTYVAHADHAQIIDNSQVEELKFWSPSAIEATLKESPDVFTKTFPHVLRATQGGR